MPQGNVSERGAWVVKKETFLRRELEEGGGEKGKPKYGPLSPRDSTFPTPGVMEKKRGTLKILIRHTSPLSIYSSFTESPFGF